MANPPLLRLFITLVVVTILTLTGCSGGIVLSPSVTPTAVSLPTLTHKVPTPTTAAQPTAVPDWSLVEAPLSSSILGTSGGKCEWEVLGWLEQKVFVWALCQAGPGPGSSAASVPAVLWIRPDQSIMAVELPGDGTAYPVSVRRLFPPAVQARVFAHNFGVKAAEDSD